MRHPFLRVLVFLLRLAGLALFAVAALAIWINLITEPGQLLEAMRYRLPALLQLIGSLRNPDAPYQVAAAIVFGLCVFALAEIIKLLIKMERGAS